uniref:Uncharacterized protein n=1 Tax=Branchiostoma floridae TaxID=7739 RepID=C3XXR8_BRAFL|eukprot:XP_002611518.1 hypothetical protein BRAFLDRAFT_63845 [Branchiostoma floridae]
MTHVLEHLYGVRNVDELPWKTKVFYNQHKTIEFFLAGRALTLLPDMPVFSRFRRRQTIDDVMAGIPWSGALVRRQRHPSVWTSVSSLTSVDIDEMLAKCSDCWFFEEKVGVSDVELDDIKLRKALEASMREQETVVEKPKLSSPEKELELEDIQLKQALEESLREQEAVLKTSKSSSSKKDLELEDIQLKQALEASLREQETVVRTPQSSSPEKTSIVVQAEVHVDSPSKVESLPNASFYQSLHRYHDPTSWEKDDSFYAYSSDEDGSVSTGIAVADVHHAYDSDSIRELEVGQVPWWALPDVPTDVLQERRRVTNNGCVCWDPLEITFEGSETITLPDPEAEQSITQKTKKPSTWKRFKCGLGRVGRRLRKLFCGCLMEEEFDPEDLYILEFKSRGIDVITV